MERIQFDNVEVARSWEDPANPGVKTHVWTIRAGDLPEIRKGANPRDPEGRIDYGVYRQIERAAKGEEGTPTLFHIKSHGIMQTARSIEKIGPETYVVTYDPDEMDGNLDGLSSQTLLTRAKAQLHPDVRIRIETVIGLDHDAVLEIAEGRNTNTQVKDVSLMDARGSFDWLKKVLGPVQNNIAWHEGEQNAATVRDLVALIVAFDTTRFDRIRMPTVTYTSKGRTLDIFETESARYEATMKGVVRGITELADIIQSTAINHYKSGGRFGALKWVSPQKTPITLPYTGRTTSHLIHGGVFSPMHAAIRSQVETDPTTGVLSWKGGFAAVEKRWDEVAEDLLSIAVSSVSSNGDNVNQTGKSEDFWRLLYATAK